ncbi:MAG: N-6 DNA methylase [Lachnospiraceae bacterium]|nr:N-6 DNA methylase [Lachnospiraceae bacterium]
MKEEKKTGSYYTPVELIRFMIEYLEKEQQDFSNVLEPSAGDGRFLSLLVPQSKHVEAIEVFEEKVKQIRQTYKERNVEVKKRNFLDYISETTKRYSLIIGNPPYINLKMMEKKDVEKAKKICEQEDLAKGTMQNMWLAFVVGAARLIDISGTIFFVLPMEFLQVQYAEKLRTYLERKFNTIHIVSFEEAIFPEIEQDVCLVYLTNRKECSAHILYEIYKTADDRKPISVNVIRKNKPLQKWSNAILKDDEISILKETKRKYKKIGDMGEIAPGIVTGGNKYFILNEEQVQEYQCIQYALPIVQKASYILEGTIEINQQVLNDIRGRKRPFYLLNLAGEKEIKNLPKPLQDYLMWAGEQKIQDIILRKRFKCANRSPWYGVPIVKIGDIVFFKRYNILPKIYINQMNVHTTDAGYHIRLKGGFDAESLVFCFFNSMTLAQCEYNGRYYGGGVSELVPSEFKELTIPYRTIEKEDIEILKQLYEKKVSVKEIVNFVNSRTIDLDFTKEETNKFEEIRLKLIKRRIG